MTPRYRIEREWSTVLYAWHVYDGDRCVTPEGLYPAQKAVVLCERLNREAEREVVSA